jgi:acetyl esterase/lipase
MEFPEGNLVALDEDVAAEAKLILANAELVLKNAPHPANTPLDETRAADRAGMQPRSADAVDIGDLRVFRMPSPDGVYLHIHGGGWMMGDNDQQDVRLWEMARNCNVTVLSVKYRLAPEHPFPANADDCETAALWLIENAVREFGTNRLTIGGESAGAHLAAVTLVRLRDRGLADRFCGANLVYGMYDMSLTDFLRNWGDRNLILNTEICRWSVEQLTPGWSDEQRRSPDVSPLYADMAGLPPALFTCGSDDPTLGDSVAMAQRWPDATLEVYLHGFHAANLFPSKLSDVWNRSIEHFIKNAIKG